MDRARASWSQGRVWLAICGLGLQAVWIIVLLLLVSSRMLDEAGLEVSAGFLEGEVTACPLVMELGLCPLVGKIVPWGVSRGGWVLRKSLGSLSDVGWTYVPVQLVVWPEASQHWCLQAVGWGQVLVLMRQDGSHQSQCWQSRMFSNMSETSVCFPRISWSSPPSLQETIQDQQVGLAQASIRLLLCPGSQCMWDFVCAL